MQDDLFEWDDTKAASNLRDHGVSFDLARLAFRDVFGVEAHDHRHGTLEERFVLLGMAESRLLFVAYTMRDDRIRIISARKAEPYERRKYHDENRDV